MTVSKLIGINRPKSDLAPSTVVGTLCLAITMHRSSRVAQTSRSRTFVCSRMTNGFLGLLSLTTSPWRRSHELAWEMVGIVDG